MKTVLDVLFSMKTTIILMLIFGAAVGIATFIENDFGRETAYVIVYGSKWLEFVMVLLTINLIGNIFVYKMWQPKNFLFLYSISPLYLSLLELL